MPPSRIAERPANTHRASWHRHCPPVGIMMEPAGAVTFVASGASPYPLARHDRRDYAPREGLVRRVHAEFQELPSLRLTAAQTQRLLNLRADICARVLQELTTAHLLTVGVDGRFSAGH